MPIPIGRILRPTCQTLPVSQSMTILPILRRSLAAAVVLLAAATALRAGPPLITDDPETPGEHGWEVNISNDVFKTRDRLLVDAPYVDLNYGTQENNQWRLQFPLVRFSDDIPGEPHGGVGDLAFGYKYRFVDEKEFGFSMSVYPQIVTPTGNRHLDVGDGHTIVILPTEIGKHFFDEKLFVYAESRYNLCTDDPEVSGWYFGVAAEWTPCEDKKLTWLGEIGDFTFPDGGAADDPFFNLGAKYKFSETVALMGSAGRSFRDRSTGAPEFMSFLGFQFTWGAEKKDEEQDDKEEKKGSEKGSD